MNSLQTRLSSLPAYLEFLSAHLLLQYDMLGEIFRGIEGQAGDAAAWMNTNDVAFHLCLQVRNVPPSFCLAPVSREIGSESWRAIIAAREDGGEKRCKPTREGHDVGLSCSQM